MSLIKTVVTSEKLINSIVVLGIYLLTYTYVIRDIYKIKVVKDFEYLEFIDYAFIFIIYLLVIQVFFQIYTFLKAFSSTITQTLNTLLFSFCFAAFFGLIIGGYYLYTYDPKLLLYVGLGVASLPLVLLILRVFFFGTSVAVKGAASKIGSFVGSMRKSMSTGTSGTSGTSGMGTMERLQLEYSILPRWAKLLIIFEVLFFIYFFTKKIILKFFIEDVYQPRGIYLEKKNFKLNQSKMIGTHNEMKNKLHANERFKYNYGLSLWMKLTPHAQEKEYANVLKYGNNPKIEYNEINNRLRIIMTDEKDKENIIYETNSIPLQRWNNIVINYFGGYFDVIINGDLVATAKNIAPYLEEDSFIIGSNKNINGHIKELIYFAKPLSRVSIQRIIKGFDIKYDGKSVSNKLTFENIMNVFK
tara:strand:- start:26 stop:1270 length:1245 start_codon:yes stop_codon:yes gene_type:complete